MRKKKANGHYSPAMIVAAKAVKGLTEAELARRAKLSEVTVREVLRGRAKKFGAVEDVARVLGLEMDITIRETA